MIDDRTVVPDQELVPTATWTYDDNLTGWEALLPGRRGGATVPEDAAPARCTDLRELPSTYLEVGELDIVRDETVRYAQALIAGVPSSCTSTRESRTPSRSGRGRATSRGARWPTARDGCVSSGARDPQPDRS